MSAGMRSPTVAYRDSVDGARLRYEDLRERTLEDLVVHADVSRVLAARTGRVWAGAAGIGGAVLMALCAAASAFVPRVVHVSPTSVLLASWPMMGAAYVIGRLAGERRQRAAALPPATGDVHADLARLERAVRAAPIRALAVRIERASTGLPMVAVGLLAPLTLHAAFRVLIGVGPDLDEWIRLSLVLVGHAHLVLAYLLWRLATKACGLAVAELRREGRRARWPILGLTVLASALPGALLFLIPPALTAVTGVAFIPLLTRIMLDKLGAERWILA
jgi:hypothetical protein